MMKTCTVCCTSKLPGKALKMKAASIMPTMPAITALMVNARSRYLKVLTPIARAASSSSRIATQARPVRLLRQRSMQKMLSARKPMKIQ